MKQEDLSTEDKLFYFQKNFFTLDGFWIVETENEFDFETALKIDIEVWMKLLPIAFKRIMKYLKIDESTPDRIIEILGFRWTAEGWEYDIVAKGKERGEVRIHKCPYKSIMERNPDRKKYIPRICKDVCIPIYKHAVAQINPKVKLSRTKFMGLGDETCDFLFIEAGD